MTVSHYIPCVRWLSETKWSILVSCWHLLTLFGQFPKLSNIIHYICFFSQLYPYYPASWTHTFLRVRLRKCVCGWECGCAWRLKTVGSVFTVTPSNTALLPLRNTKQSSLIKWQYVLQQFHIRGHFFHFAQFYKHMCEMHFIYLPFSVGV